MAQVFVSISSKMAQMNISIYIHLLANLDGTDRKLLLAFSLEGKPTKQIAREMNLSDGQVRVRLHRIRRKLKKGMNDDA